MAGTKDYAVLDLQDESDALGVDLQFQGIRTTAFDFGDTRTQPNSNSHEQTITFTDFPDTPEEELEQEKLLGEEDDEEKPIGLKKGTGFWTFEFYQQFFDVESKQVGDRILWSMVPKPGVSYLQSYIRPNPDLYGPFWICMTLTFTTAITGNLANYLGTRPEESYIWRYDFHKVTLAATAIFSYAWLVPMAMWGVLVWRGSRAKISLLELLCIYGYSLAIFVPVSILWIVPQPWFKWCLAIVAPVLSGSVLVRTVWPSLSHDAKQVAIGIAVFILVLHATLALGFMLYFFAAPDRAQTPMVPAKPAEGPDTKDNQTSAPSEKTSAVKKETKKSVDEATPKGIPGGGGGKGKSDDGDASGKSESAKPLEEKSDGKIKKKSISPKPTSKPTVKKPTKDVESNAAPKGKGDASVKPTAAAPKQTIDADAAEQNSSAAVAKSKTSQDSKA